MGVVRNGDAVVVTKLDRMARNTRDGLTIIDEPLARGIQINILNMGKFDSSSTGKLMRRYFLRLRNLNVTRLCREQAKARRSAMRTIRTGKKCSNEKTYPAWKK